MGIMQKLLYSVLLVFMLTSCSSVLITRIDVLRPGYFVAASDKDAVLLVDNSGAQPTSYGHTLSENCNIRIDSTFSTKPLSGLLLESVSRTLLNENFYKNISVSQKNDTLSDPFFIPSKRTLQQMNVMGGVQKYDLVISLDRILVKTVTDLQYYDSFRATRDVLVNTVWRVFDVAADSLITQFQYNDSLFWEQYSITPEYALKIMPKLNETLPEIGDVVGEHVSKFLGPYWETVDRYFFCTGSYRMKIAADRWRQKDMDGAASLWREEFEKGFGRSVYRSAMNMMLYSEFTGNPMEALSWSKKAEDAVARCPFGITSYDRFLFQGWVVALHVRAADLEKLKIYFNGNLNQ